LEDTIRRSELWGFELNSNRIVFYYGNYDLHLDVYYKDEENIGNYNFSN